MNSLSATAIGDGHDEVVRERPAESAGTASQPTSAPIAYIMSRFPLLTETFILREMLELERQGMPLEIYPLLRAEPAVRHDELGQLKAQAHYTPFLSAPIVAANIHYLKRNWRRYLGLVWSVLKGNWGSANLFTGALGIFPKSVYIARLIEAQGVRHVHAHYATHPALCALIVSELTGIGFSFTAHAHDIFMHRRMLAEKIARARFVAAISTHNKDYLLRLAPDVPADRIKVIHCGIELGNYEADRATKTAGDCEDPITVICVASLQAYKGIAHLIRACAQVVRERPAFRCLVAGEGAERPKLEALIGELGLQDSFHLLGGRPQREVARLLKEADLFVLPSIVAPSGQMDGIPVALMEAMASRLPVISTRLSGIPELVEDEVNGLLVSPGDELALADAILRLSRDPATRRRMGARGREKVAAEFELKGCVATLRGLFDEAVGQDTPKRGITSGIVPQSSPIDPDIAEWVKRELELAQGAVDGVEFKRLGGGADSQVFEVEYAREAHSRSALILKLHRPNGGDSSELVERNHADAENDFLALSYLWSVFSPQSARLGVPRPVALERKRAAVLMEKCPGQRLDRAIRWARFRPGSRESLLHWFAACGEWLARFHNATATEDDPGPVCEDLTSEFFDNLKRCRERGLDTDLADAATTRFETGKHSAFGPLRGLVGRHCDFAPYNVLVAGDRISVIDFEGLQQGIVYDDLCYFLRMLEVTPPYHLGRKMISMLRETFLGGYEAHRPLDRGAIDFFMLLATARVMARTPVLRPSLTGLAALKRQQRLRFYREWFAERLQ